MKNLILCGPGGVGKTTVGKLLSEKLSLKFVNTDTLLEARYNQMYSASDSCRDIFLKLGEEGFRFLENEVIFSLGNSENAVIVLGGGSLLNPSNLKMLKELGTIIYLKASLTILWNRLLSRKTPAYLNSKEPKESLKKTLRKRAFSYEQAQKLTIDTSSLTPQEVVEEILNQLKSYGQ